MHGKWSIARRVIVLLLPVWPIAAPAAWDIVTHTDTDTATQTRVAYTENGEGYSLEIYRDGSGAIRSRFGTRHSLGRLAEKTCPTYQVDDRKPGNRSINDAACISHRQWAEFILGYIDNNQVTSTLLHNMMNGNKVTFRFILENGGYAETEFSLSGSKRILTEILGRQLVVRTDNGFTN